MFIINPYGEHNSLTIQLTNCTLTEKEELQNALDHEAVKNAIEQMKRADNVRNYESYLISTLFNEANGKRFKENAEGRWAEYAVKRDFGVYDD